MAAAPFLGLAGWKLSQGGRNGEAGGSGQEVWTFRAEDVVTSDPAVAEGAVYVGSNDQNVYALEAASGRKLWSYTTGAAVDSGPAVADGVVYVGSSDLHIYALSARTGALVWKFAAGGAVTCDLLVAGGLVYANISGGPLFLLDASTGKLRGQVANDAQSPTPAAVVGGVLYIGDGNGSLFAFDPPARQPAWHFAGPPGQTVTAGPVVSGGVAIFVCNDNTLYAVRAANGEQLWTLRGIPIGTSYLAAASGIAYVYGTAGGSYALTALDALTGAVRWKVADGGIQLIRPAVSGGIVYAGGTGNISAYRARTGAKVWEFDFDGVSSAPAVASGMVYFGGGADNQFYAVRA